MAGGRGAQWTRLLALWLLLELIPGAYWAWYGVRMTKAGSVWRALANTVASRNRAATLTLPAQTTPPYSREGRGRL